MCIRDSLLDRGGYVGDRHAPASIVRLVLLPGSQPRSTPGYSRVGEETPAKSTRSNTNRRRGSVAFAVNSARWLSLSKPLAELVEAPFDKLRDRDPVAQAGRRRRTAGDGVLTSRLRPYFSPSALTACPPNWLRMAATIFMAGESSCCETKRANSDAAIVGTGTPNSTAALTVQRPSPESAA